MCAPALPPWPRVCAAARLTVRGLACPGAREGTAAQGDGAVPSASVPSSDALRVAPSTLDGTGAGIDAAALLDRLQKRKSSFLDDDSVSCTIRDACRGLAASRRARPDACVPALCRCARSVLRRSGNRTFCKPPTPPFPATPPRVPRCPAPHPTAAPSPPPPTSPSSGAALTGAVGRVRAGEASRLRAKSFCGPLPSLKLRALSACSKLCKACPFRTRPLIAQAHAARNRRAVWRSGVRL